MAKRLLKDLKRKVQNKEADFAKNQLNSPVPVGYYDYIALQRRDNPSGIVFLHSLHVSSLRTALLKNKKDKILEFQVHNEDARIFLKERKYNENNTNDPV